MPETVQVPAIGYSITANLGGDRQIVLQHFIGADESDAEVNKVLDRIMRLIDRQKAILEIPDLRAARDKYAGEIAQYEEDLATAEGKHAEAQASLDVEIEHLQTTSKEVHDTAYDAFRASGRQGAFKPSGQTKSQLDRAADGVKRAQEAKAKNEAERHNFLNTVGVSIDRRKAEIAIIEGKIAEAEKVT